MRNKIVTYLSKHPLLNIIQWLYYVILGICRFYGFRKFNLFELHAANLYKSKIIAIGEGNTIDILDNVALSSSTIIIRGSINRVRVGEGSQINGLQVIIEGDGNLVEFGSHTFIFNDTRVYVVDGSTLSVGEHCMFADRIDIRTTNNHAILDMHTGIRLNYEKDVILGNNVWVGTGVNILKGSTIADWCIVGARALIAGKYDEANCIIVGNPGKVIKHDVVWQAART